jgi:hypothetical protein
VAYWSYSCGVKGVSAVRVYERSVSPALYIEWYPGGRRRQRSLKSFAGKPVTDRRTAKRIAIEYAAFLERESNRTAQARVAAVLAGQPLLLDEEHTLGELCERYRAHHSPRWSDHHRKAQQRYRDFWLAKFGADCPLDAVTEGRAEELAAALDVSDKTRRHHLSYLKAAYRFAWRKLKWIDERHSLSGLDLPSGTGRLPSYTREEAAKLLPELEKISDEAGWMGHAAWQSGRRSRALRTVLKADVDVRDAESIVVFRAETDKAGKAGTVILRGRAHELTARLMRKPGRYLLGKEPPHHKSGIGWLRKAETAAGVAYVRSRGWHAFKKRFATDTEGMAGRGRQAGTLETTLNREYTEDELPAKREVAERIREITG